MHPPLQQSNWPRFSWPSATYVTVLINPANSGCIRWCSITLTAMFLLLGRLSNRVSPAQPSSGGQPHLDQPNLALPSPPCPAHLAHQALPRPPFPTPSRIQLPEPATPPNSQATRSVFFGLKCLASHPISIASKCKRSVKSKPLDPIYVKERSH